MYTQVEKPKENKNSSVANSVSQKKNNGKKGFGFVDNRPESKQFAQLQAMICNHSAHQPIQKKENNTGLPDNLQNTIQLVAIYENNVAQRVWKTMGPGNLKWDKLIDGVEWFYHREDETFSYKIIEAKEGQGTLQPYEGVHLTEEELDELGLEEIIFEQGEDRVEYEAPEPQFAPVDVRMVTKMSEQALVKMLTVHLERQTALINYDRLSYINAFLTFAAQNPFPTPQEALASFDAQAPRLLEQMRGGHCGALSGSLLQECEAGAGAYIVASKLPADYQQKKAPEYCHVAALIRFQSPDDASDNGLILLEPGFNITQPIVVKKGRITSLVQEPEIWDFSVNDEMTEIICQPRPADPKETWKSRKSRDKCMTYRTDVFLNPDMSLTAPLLRIDGRPQILARDEKGNLVAVIAINYAKRQIEFRIGTDKGKPIPFAQVDQKGEFLGQAAGPLAELLHMSPSELIQRLYDAVANWQPEKV